jgi:uncharacterized protein YecE (DUF72 family)
LPIEFKIGCSGFYYKNWKGVFYPEKLAQNKWLAYYATQFNTLELNSTFYRFPTLETMENWYKKVPDNFVFSVKAPRVITHLKKLKDCEKLLDDFYTVCEAGLKKKLGCLLFQFPPSSSCNAEMMLKVLNALRPGFKNVAEFRHPTCWNKEVFDLLSEKRISFCSISHPSLPDDIITTSDVAYVRMHGVPVMFQSDYSLMELEALKKKLSKNKEIKEAWVYFNNTDGKHGYKNALDLKKMVGGL